MELTARQEIIIWLTNGRLCKKLRRFGTIIYVSFKMKYVIMYVNSAQAKEKIAQIAQLDFVKDVKLSPRQDLKTDYSEEQIANLHNISNMENHQCE